MPKISFETKLLKIGSWTILRLPKGESAKLPSRAIVMVKGLINEIPFQAVLEPDGIGSHWFRVDESLRKSIRANVGDTVKLEMKVSDEWIEPVVPTDLKKALAGVPAVDDLWQKITPNARWDWIRWIRATKNPGTRKRRIEVAVSKMRKGTRRPCCFNRNLCTVSDVSQNWLLKTD